MKRKRFTAAPIAFALRQAHAGTSALEICRKLGIGEPTFYRWKKLFAGMGVAEIRRLKQLEEESKRLKVRSAAPQVECTSFGRTGGWLG